MNKFLALAVSFVALMPSTAPALANGPEQSNGHILIATKDSDIVDFNTNTLKFHDPNCLWARRCTVHCIKITRSEAFKRGGVPCKVCGGGVGSG
jgi:hypothetical protein